MDPNPFKQFEQWFQAATEAEPEAPLVALDPKDDRQILEEVGAFDARHGLVRQRDGIHLG